MTRTTPKEERIFTGIHLPVWMWADLKVLAMERRCRSNDLVVQAIGEFLERNPPTWQRPGQAK